MKYIDWQRVRQSHRSIETGRKISYTICKIDKQNLQLHNKNKGSIKLVEEIRKYMVEAKINPTEIWNKHMFQIKVEKFKVFQGKPSKKSMSTLSEESSRNLGKKKNKQSKPIISHGPQQASLRNGRMDYKIIAVVIIFTKTCFRALNLFSSGTENLGCHLRME